MDVVRHDLECVELYPRMMIGKFVPAELEDVAQVVEVHFVVLDLTEQAETIEGADGDEVRTGSGVVEPLEADGLAVRERWCRGHATCLETLTAGDAGVAPTRAGDAGVAPTRA